MLIELGIHLGKFCICSSSRLLIVLESTLSHSHGAQTTTKSTSASPNWREISSSTNWRQVRNWRECTRRSWWSCECGSWWKDCIRLFFGRLCFLWLDWSWLRLGQLWTIISEAYTFLSVLLRLIQIKANTLIRWLFSLKICQCLNIILLDLSSLSFSLGLGQSLSFSLCNKVFSFRCQACLLKFQTLLGFSLVLLQICLPLFQFSLFLLQLRLGVSYRLFLSFLHLL